MENLNWTPIFQAILTLAGLLITGFVVPWLRTKISADQLQSLKHWVQIAVKAAEQLHDGKGGGYKKQFVLDFLNSKGISISSAELDALIESAVHELGIQDTGIRSEVVTSNLYPESSPLNPELGD